MYSPEDRGAQGEGPACHLGWGQRQGLGCLTLIVTLALTRALNITPDGNLGGNFDTHSTKDAPDKWRQAFIKTAQQCVIAAELLQEAEQVHDEVLSVHVISTEVFVRLVVVSTE